MSESRRERVFSFLSKDKEAIEVVAAAELFEAVTRARDTLLQAADAADAQRPTRGKILRYLATMLDTDDLDPGTFSPEQRGNARRLCLSIRRFFEACGSIASQKDWQEILGDVLKLVKWAGHAPLTTSKLEFSALQAAPTQSWTAGAILEIKAESLRDVALRLPIAVAHMVNKINHSEDLQQPRDFVEEFFHACTPEDIWVAVGQLGTKSGEWRDRFECIGKELGIGKYGATIGEQPWRDACKNDHHHLILCTLALEAAEHLKRPREKEAEPVKVLAISELRRICFGMRLFGAVIENALLTCQSPVTSRIHELKKHTHWAAHAPTDKRFNNKPFWKNPGDKFSPAGITTMCELFDETCQLAYSQVDLVRVIGLGLCGELKEPPGEAFSELSKESWHTWGWRLWVALELGRQDIDNPALVGPFYSGDGLVHLRHRVPFLLEAEAMMTGAAPVDKRLFFLRARHKVCKEIAFISNEGASEITKQLNELCVATRDKLRNGSDGFLGPAIRNGSGLLPTFRRLATLNFKEFSLHEGKIKDLIEQNPYHM